MPFFGVNGPGRLLRTDWRNPVELAHELYAMFTSRGPQQVEGPVTIQVPRGESGLVIEPAPARASEAVAAYSTPRARAASVAQAPQFEAPARGSRGDAGRPAQALADPAPRPASSAQADAARRAFEPYEAPLLAIKGPVAFEGSSPVQFREPPVLFNPDLGGFAPLVPERATAPDQVCFVALVNSGTGSSWDVTLYPDGRDGEEGDDVTVTIPTILATEAAPVGTFIGPVFKTPAEDYFYQPPVWM